MTTDLDLAVSAYRANPTPENHDWLSLQQELEYYRGQSTLALERMWVR